jgi:predicted RNase H-like HicB family nuclease
MERLKLTALLYPQENGAYTIVCPEINKTTQGDTIEDALFMMRNLAIISLMIFHQRKNCRK